MRRFTLILTAIIAVIANANTVNISKEDALSLVKQQLGNKPFDYYVASVNEVYDDGEGSCVLDSVPNETWLKCPQKKWLFFVDEQPMTNWGHKCSFFYVPQENPFEGQMTILLNTPFMGNETICVTSVSGNSLPVNIKCAKGDESIEIQTNDIPSGQCLVSLLQNGKDVETLHATKK